MHPVSGAESSSRSFLASVSPASPSAVTRRSPSPASGHLVPMGTPTTNETMSDEDYEGRREEGTRERHTSFHLASDARRTCCSFPDSSASPSSVPGFSLSPSLPHSDAGYSSLFSFSPWFSRARTFNLLSALLFLASFAGDERRAHTHRPATDNTHTHTHTLAHFPLSFPLMPSPLFLQPSLSALPSCSFLSFSSLFSH